MSIKLDGLQNHKLLKHISMKHILFVCCLFVLQPFAHATEISVGGTSLSIPSPTGYSQITTAMKPFSELAARVVPPSNEQMALFLPIADVKSAAKGGIPDSIRRLAVQVAKKLIHSFVTNADFAEIKQTMKTQNDKMLKEIEAESPGIFEKLNKGILRDYDLDLKLSNVQMIPLPPHYETERSLAYSIISKVNVKDENGKSSIYEEASTVTLVHLQGKVLFLYVFSEKKGLDWSRTESQKWADTVMAANPSVGAVAIREASSSRSGFDWSKVGSGTLAGAFAGLIIGTIGYVFKKARRK